MSTHKTLRASGFTIVELLIVIVVIAILASVSIVAYNGVQARARDTELKSDLNNLGKFLSLFNAEKGAFPSSDTEFKSILIDAGYWDITRNGNSQLERYILCTSPTNNGIVQMSTRGESVKWWAGADRPYWSTVDGIKIAQATSGSTALNDVCADIGINSLSTYRNWAHNLT